MVAVTSYSATPQKAVEMNRRRIARAGALTHRVERRLRPVGQRAVGMPSKPAYSDYDPDAARLDLRRCAPAVADPIEGLGRLDRFVLQHALRSLPAATYASAHYQWQKATTDSGMFSLVFL